ncbi:MAG: phage holin family protein [Bacteroidales bacterium]|jgi:putative membrane protein|nr:phage holin family protein [Bacteroidales bacterium]
MKEYKFTFNGGGASPKSKGFWLKVLIMALAIFITSLLFSIVKANPLSAFVAAVVISLLNNSLRPLLAMISLPLIIFSFGLFYIVINAIIVLLASWLIPGFEVNGLFNAILFSIIVTLLSYLIELPTKYRRIQDSEDDSDDDKGSNVFTSYEDVTPEKDNEKTEE